MKIKIFQINRERDPDFLKFKGLTDLHFRTGSPNPNPAIYDKVFDGCVDAKTLEDVFVLFNQDQRPENFAGHSLSISDVVVVEQSNSCVVPLGSYYCDTWGWPKLQEFNFQEETK